MTDLERTELAVQQERALLMAVILPETNVDPYDPLGELRSLAKTAGALVLKDNITGRDSPLVAGLRSQGAIILGKTNLSQPWL